MGSTLTVQPGRPNVLGTAKQRPPLLQAKSMKAMVSASVFEMEIYFLFRSFMEESKVMSFMPKNQRQDKTTNASVHNRSWTIQVVVSSGNKVKIREHQKSSSAFLLLVFNVNGERWQNF